jgi:hypothetical protein
MILSAGQVPCGRTQQRIRPPDQVSSDQDSTKTSGYKDQLVKVATDIRLHPKNIKREKGLKLSKAWNPSTRSLGHTNT